MVSKWFLTYGIPSALDGTKDTAIYEEELETHTKDNKMDEEFDVESEYEPWGDILDRAVHIKKTNGSFRSHYTYIY